MLGPVGSGRIRIGHLFILLLHPVAVITRAARVLPMVEQDAGVGRSPRYPVGSCGVHSWLEPADNGVIAQVPLSTLPTSHCGGIVSFSDGCSSMADNSAQAILPFGERPFVPEPDLPVNFASLGIEPVEDKDHRILCLGDDAGANRDRWLWLSFVLQPALTLVLGCDLWLFPSLDEVVQVYWRSLLLLAHRSVSECGAAKGF